MIREVLARYPHGLISGIGLLIFLGIFIGWCLWVFRRDGLPIYRRMETLPLEDQND